jgi:hypothetical protein
VPSELILPPFLIGSGQPLLRGKPLRPARARRGFHAISGLQDIGKLVDSVMYVAK